MPESIPTLEWRRKKGALVAQIPGGDLSIVSVSGAHDLWFSEHGAWGTNQHLGTHATVQDAKGHANVWVGDNTTATG